MKKMIQTILEVFGLQDPPPGKQIPKHFPWLPAEGYEMRGNKWRRSFAPNNCEPVEEELPRRVA